VTIRLERVGSASAGTPVVMIPGIDGSSGSVLPIAQALGASRPVYIANYTAEQNPSVETLSKEIEEAIGKEITGPFDVVGQSIGTIFASQVASAPSSGVRRVVLCCTFTKLRWTTMKISNAMLSITPNAIFSATSPTLMKLVCGPVGDGKNHPFFEASRRAEKAGVIKRTAWQIGRDFAPDIAAVRSPMLVLMGAKDRFVPDIDRELSTLREILAERDASVHTVPEAGHVLLPSQAVAFAAEKIDEFLNQGAPM
jgi:pimeloyl-ACP methyl ester carboxylesterase